MKTNSAFKLLVLLLCCMSNVYGDELALAKSIIEKANTWKPGEPLPKEVLVYRGPAVEKRDLGTYTDTGFIYYSITNFPLLVEVLLSPQADDLSAGFARGYAAKLVGPNRLFREIRSRFKSEPGLLERPRNRELKDESEQYWVMVEGVSIGRDVRSKDEAFKIFEGMRKELAAGTKWDDLVKKHMYLGEKRSKTAPPWPTLLGFHGDFLVSKTRRDDLPIRRTQVPPDHLQAILNAREGQTLIMDNPAEALVILYRVKEVYKPWR